MRARQIVRASFVIGAAVLLVSVVVPTAVGERELGQHVAGVALRARSLGAAGWFNDGLADVLVSEGLVLLVCAIGCVLLVAGMEAFDLWREQREADGARLCARIAHALTRDSWLAPLAVTPIACTPRRCWSRGMIELRGQVPTPWLRSAVLRAAEREIIAHAAPYRIRGRLAVIPPPQGSALGEVSAMRTRERTNRLIAAAAATH